ncbi:MAG: hypothetical protein M3Q42_04890 [Pseudomonadota bacterium]|nr:hypothetical protein [Pseudomonadota bacterium]
MKTRGNRWGPVIWGGAALLLLAPLVAMQFTGEVNWDETDFMVVGAMLLAACGTYELATRVSGNTAYRVAAGIAVVTAFVLVWVNLAVGVFGSEDNPANLMFGGVIAVAIVGSIAARFQARRMATVFNTTAAAQALVAAIGLLLGFGPTVLLAALFAMPWLVSARLFRKAAHETGGAKS